MTSFHNLNLTKFPIDKLNSAKAELVDFVSYRLHKNGFVVALFFIPKCRDDELKEVGQRGVQFQSIFDARNKHKKHFFCDDNS